MRWFIFTALAIIYATIVEARETQDDVLDCLGKIGVTTEWNGCLEAMFADCAGDAVGSAAQLACLVQEREDWRMAKTRAETRVLERLSADGMAEFSGLMLAWPRFVEDKCAAVAEARAEISAEAARLGCEISELALLTNELTACNEGRSVEEYCDLTER